MQNVNVIRLGLNELVEDLMASSNALARHLNCGGGFRDIGKDLVRTGGTVQEGTGHGQEAAIADRRAPLVQRGRLVVLGERGKGLLQPFPFPPTCAARRRLA